MVNNFTYINKTSNHASSYFTEHKKDQRYMTLEIQALASRKSGGVNPFTILKKNTKINYWDIERVLHLWFMTVFPYDTHVTKI